MSRLSLPATKVFFASVRSKPIAQDPVQAVPRLEAARNNGRTQGKSPRVADLLAQSRQSPANRGRKLASSGETRLRSPGQAPLAGGVTARDRLQQPPRRLPWCPDFNSAGPGVPTLPRHHPPRPPARPGSAATAACAVRRSLRSPTASCYAPASIVLDQGGCAVSLAPC